MGDEVWLFSYGTLRQTEVQRALFGRELQSEEDRLTGFALGTVTIRDPEVVRLSGSDRHPILRRAGADSAVEGTALALTQAEIEAADQYEVADYVRIPVTLASGRDAFVYVHAQEAEPMTADGVALVDPDAALGLRLLPVARQIFTDTFAGRFDRDALAAFCDAAYLPGGTMARDLAAVDVHWRVAAVDDAPIGYVKLTPLRAPAPDPQRGSMELQQIYLRAEWHGSGVADRLMQWAIDQAQSLGAPDLYLTVFDDNDRAKRFYARYGFGEVGRCGFEIGGRTFDDRVWRKRLLPV